MLVASRHLLTTSILIAVSSFGGCEAFGTAPPAGGSSGAPPGGSSGAPGADDASAPPTGGADASKPSLLVLHDNFDTDVDAGWTMTDVAAPSLIVVTTDTSLSPPRCLQAVRPKVGALKGRAWRVRTVPGWPSIRLTFDTFIHAPWSGSEDDTAAVAVAGLLFDSATTPVNAQLIVDKTSIQLNTTAPNHYYKGDGALSPLDRWVHVIIEVEPRTAGGRVFFSIDGKRISGESDVAFTAAPESREKVRIFLGLEGYNADAPSFIVNYDNVSIEQY